MTEVRTVHSFKQCGTQWPSRALPSGHHIRIAKSLGQRFSQTFRLNKSVLQQCFTISAANKCRHAECRLVITSRRWKQKSIQSAAVGGRTHLATGNPQESGGVVRYSTQTLIELTILARTPRSTRLGRHNSLSDFLVFCPDPNSIQNLDGKEK